MKTLIVFSHLRWNFVYQRPQHLMSRLAKRWNVIFIEEPVTQDADDRIERIDAAPGVQVWRPHLRAEQPGFHSENLPALQRLIGDAMRESAVADYWAWFYTPMALPLVDSLNPECMVYDCMDELSAFRHAPPQLVEMENALFKAADIVFTGGRSLYNAKKGRHANVHCFPSSVDARHFARVSAGHPLMADIPAPRLGYCGVIDERIDLGLIEGMADARPHWQLVMVGPVVKIDPAILPRRPNIHWLGQQSYNDLPAFISGWDVCLLPFALNESTQFISPTKTLEYMACGRPSVSTAIRDVVEPYGHVVDIASDTAGFVKACDAILARTAGQQQDHARQLAAIVARTSWDATADAMADLMVPRAPQGSLPKLPAQPAGATAGQGTAVLAG